MSKNTVYRGIIFWCCSAGQLVGVEDGAGAGIEGRFFEAIWAAIIEFSDDDVDMVGDVGGVRDVALVIGLIEGTIGDMIGVISILVIDAKERIVVGIVGRISVQVLVNKNNVGGGLLAIEGSL